MYPSPSSPPPHSTSVYVSFFFVIFSFSTGYVRMSFLAFWSFCGRFLFKVCFLFFHAILRLFFLFIFCWLVNLFVFCFQFVSISILIFFFYIFLILSALFFFHCIIFLQFSFYLFCIFPLKYLHLSPFPVPFPFFLLYFLSAPRLFSLFFVLLLFIFACFLYFALFFFSLFSSGWFTRAYRTWSSELYSWKTVM